MRIFILRHGQAEYPVTTDEARELTPKGRADTKQILQLCGDDMKNLGAIYTSPLVRAQQTAAIAATFFSGVQIETTSLLVPEAAPIEVYEWLVSLGCESVLLVSHQPLVGTLVNQLCGTAPGYYSMGTSSLAAIDVSTPTPLMGTMHWLHHAQH
jgi:phosphohistidine phosphatase